MAGIEIPGALNMAAPTNVTGGKVDTSTLDPKAKKAAQQFESYYIQQFMELTQPPADTKSMFYGGIGEEMFRHQLNETMANNISKQGGFGLAQGILKQMAQRQAAAAYSASLAASGQR